MWMNFDVNGPQLHLAQTYNKGALPLRVHQPEAFKQPAWANHAGSGLLKPRQIRHGRHV